MKINKAMPILLYRTGRGIHKVNPKATAISIDTAGSFPSELAEKNAGAEIVVSAAPAVTAPDGAKGSKRNAMIAQNTVVFF